MKTLLSILLSASVAFTAQAPAQGTPQDQLDIAGVHIGMTEAEARAALAAFDPEIEVGAVMAMFNYSDGMNMLQSPEFLDRLEAGQLPGLGPAFKVYFSGPVGEVRVIGVARSGLMMTNPPTAAQFVDSLLSKYGRPAGLSCGDRTQPVWEAAGRPSCIRARDYKDEVPISVAAGAGESLADTGTAKQFLVRRSYLNTRGLIPDEPTQCGTYLSYYFPQDPVQSFQVEVFDLGAMVSTERSRTAWVSELQAEAVRQRQGRGVAPRL
ncbi:MAG: hypothetical protein JJT85_07110 [Chromatiales bacterium]|nr:hypothetical protein [Chromatiales bacterium]